MRPKGRALDQQHPKVHSICADCGYTTRVIAGSMRWVDGLGSVKKRCLRCGRVGWYLRQADGGAFVVWKWPQVPPVYDTTDCQFKGCPFQRMQGHRFCQGHRKMHERRRPMRLLDPRLVIRNRLGALKRKSRKAER